MAVLALPAIAGALAGAPLPIGIALAYTVAGGIIDQRLIFPHLFGADPPKRPALGDLQTVQAYDGQPANRLVAGVVRVPCAVVYKSPLRAVEDTSASSGKGGPGAQVPITQYFCDLGIQVGRRVGPEPEIVEVISVLANTKVLHETQPNFAPAASTAVTAAIKTVQAYGAVSIRYLILTADLDTVGAPDLSQLQSGKDAVVSGFVGSAAPFSDGVTSGTNSRTATELSMKTATGGTLNVDDTLEIAGHPAIYRVKTSTVMAAGIENDVPVEPKLVAAIPSTAAAAITVRRGASSNNGTWLVVTSSLDPVTNISSVTLENKYFPDTGIGAGVYPFAAKAAGDPVVVFQSQPSSQVGRFARIDFKLGSRDQAPDDILVQQQASIVPGGAPQLYAGRGRVEVWIEDLNLTDFGNVVPQFEAIVRVSSDESLTSTLALALDDAGLAGRYDVSAVSGTCRGYWYQGAQQPRQFLQPIFLYFGLVAREDVGLIRFAPRTALPQVTADHALDELAAHETGGNAPRPFQVVEQPPPQLPFRVDLTYVDASKDYQRLTRASSLTRPDGRGISTADLSPLVLTKDEATQAADRLLALAWASNRSFRGTAAPELRATLVAGALLTAKNSLGRTWTVLVTRSETGPDGIVRWEGRYEDAEAVSQTASGGTVL